MALDRISVHEDKRVTGGISIKTGNYNIEKQKPIQSVKKSINEKVIKTSKKKGKKKKSFLKKKFTSKPILKKARVTIKIKEHEPAPYVNRYIKGEMAEARSMLFK